MFYDAMPRVSACGSIAGPRASSRRSISGLNLASWHFEQAGAVDKSLEQSLVLPRSCSPHARSNCC